MLFKLKSGAILPLAIAAIVTGCHDKNDKAVGYYANNNSPSDIVRLSGGNGSGEGNSAFHPVITLSSSVTVNEGNPFEILGSVSTADQFTWTQISGPNLSISEENGSLRLDLTAPKVTEDTQAVIRLTAQNRYGVTSEDVLINIHNIPVPPTAKAGEDRTVDEGETVALQGSATVAEGEPQVNNYQWKQISGPPVTIENPNLSNLLFTAPEVASEAEIEFEFIAMGEVPSSPDRVVVTVLNKTPLANAGDTIEVREGESFTLDGSRSKQNGAREITQYTWVSVDGAFQIPEQVEHSAMHTLTAPGVDADTDYRFGLTVSDGTDSSPEAFVIVRVLDGGDRPSVAVNDITVAQNVAVVVDASASTEPKNRSLTFQWVQVLAEGATPINFDASNNGSQINFVAPSVTEDTIFQFNVKAFNGFNYSDTATVNVKVIGEETYSGERIQLKGNPYTALGDRLDLGVTAYSLEVVGTNAYITYHETKKNEAGIQPTGLMVVDISNEKEPKIVKNYPLAWAGEENITTVQMRLAVDPEQKYAYIAEKHLAGSEDANAIGIVRIDLTATAVEGNNGVQLQKAEEDNSGDQFSDIVMRGGQLYGLEYTDTGAIYRISENAESGEMEYTQMWSALEGKTDDVMGSMDITADGRVAVIMDLFDITVIHFAEDGTVAAEFEVAATQMDSGRQGRRHIAIDANGEYAVASFQSAISGTNVQPANRYSAVEKLDIRNIAEADRAANHRFSTPEQALGIVTQGGITFVASGQQGLQMLDSNDAEALTLKTYYQTPMRAVDVAVNLEGKRAYTVGDQSFSIADLTSQDAPAMATNWVEDYFANVQAGENRKYPLAATDVELVTVPDVGTYAVVAQSRDQNREASNLLFVDQLGTENWSINTVDYSPVYKGRNKVRLTEYAGDIYTLYNETGSSGVRRIKNSTIATTAPTLEKVTPRNTSGIAFFNNEAALLSQDADFWSWSLVDAKEIRNYVRLFNVYFFGSGMSESTSRVLGAGMYNSEGEGCWLIDVNGEGNNFSRLFYPAPEGALVQASAVTNNANTCYAGFGYDSSLYQANDRDEYRSQYPFGILTVNFTTAVDLIDVDPSEPDEKWEDAIDPANVARQSIYALPDNPEEILPVGHRLYVADATFGGVQILNASNPTHLVLEGVLHTEDSAQGLDVTEDESLVVVADDDMRGIVQIPIEFPTIERTDNDALTALLETEKAIANADAHAVEQQILTFTVDWTREEYDQITCYATTDNTPWGNETCTVTPIEGDTTSAALTWALPEGDIDQEIRVAVGNNIEFLSTSFQIFVDKLAANP